MHAQNRGLGLRVVNKEIRKNTSNKKQSSNIDDVNHRSYDLGKKSKLN